jgi:hypothetical protein
LMTATSSIENDMAELDVNKVLGTWLDNLIPQAYEQRTADLIADAQDPRVHHYLVPVRIQFCFLDSVHGRESRFRADCDR